MAQIILDSSNNLIQGDFDNATLNNRTKFKTTTLNGTTNVYAVPNGSSTSAGYSVSNAADPTNASKITIATNGSTDTQIISGINGTGTYLPMSFYTNNTLAMQIGTNGQMTVAATANPAFSAYAGSAQNTTSNVYTKVLFPNEEFDTNSNFASSTFTPTVAGYYQINTSVSVNGSPARFAMQLYKNGSAYKMLTDITCGSGTTPNAISGSAVVYLNGSTDYVEIYANQVSATGFYSNSTTVFTWFNGSFIRSA